MSRPFEDVNRLPLESRSVGRGGPEDTNSGCMLPLCPVYATTEQMAREQGSW